MRSLRFGWLVGALAISLARSGPAEAGGDPAAGKPNSVVCAACHVASDPVTDGPRLAGQGERYLARQLAAFKRGDRVNPLMSAIARQLSDADIANQAAFWSAQPAGSDVAPAPAAAAIRRSRMDFPRGFPNGFVLYATSNIADQNTIRKTYINTIGWQAARSNKPLPDGSAILVAICTAKLDAEKRPVLDRTGALMVDKITSYSGMEMRAGWGDGIPALLRNANWNYRTFTADKAPGETNQAACLACHKPQAAVSYVFTNNELQDKASAR
jgi:cytochrome c553